MKNKQVKEKKVVVSTMIPAEQKELLQIKANELGISLCAFLEKILLNQDFFIEKNQMSETEKEIYVLKARLLELEKITKYTLAKIEEKQDILYECFHKTKEYFFKIKSNHSKNNVL